MTDITITLDERAKTHGDFSDVAFISQAIKSLINESKADFPDEQREALDLIASKIARICSGNNNDPDHWRDIEGYSRLARKQLEY
tara:strand:+ start:602 stop:856 length:255 start_codon:yes stop_codon:yes gene_type:complete